MRHAGTCILGGAILCTTSVLAQSEPPGAASRGSLEEVVVTAQKREQSVNDIGMSVAALTASQLESRNIDGAADLARIVPGFSFADTGVNAPVYSLRGVGYFDYSLAASPAVSVYVDEVPLAYPTMTLGAAFDLQRVEVLKGPQGTLFGQNSTGGLVNYIAQRPTHDFDAGVTLGYGRFNRTELEGHISGPLTDTLRARVAVQNVQSDAWQKSLTRDDENGETDRTSARVLLDWDASENLVLKFNINGYVDQGQTQATQAIAITPLTPAGLRPEVRDAPMAPADARAADWSATRDLARDDEFYQASLRAEWRIADTVELTSISAYSDLKTRTYIDRDGMVNDNSQYDLMGSIRGFTQELRVAGEAGRLKWLIGGTYSADETRENQSVSIESASNVQNTFGVKFSDASNRIRNDIETHALFVNGDWMLTDSLSLTTGARYTETSLDFRGCTALTEPAAIQAFTNISVFFRDLLGLPPAQFIPANGCVTLGSDFLPVEPHKKLTEDNVSWRTALNWRVTDDVLAYVSASRGYKAGNSITVAGSGDAQYDPVTQERLTAYETGLKATLLERSMQLNAAAFYYDYRDKQARSKIVDPVFGPLQALVNIPRSHAYGAELELQWAPITGLTINLGSAYLNTQIDEFTGFAAIGNARDFSGQPFSFAPKWQHNLDVDYQWPLGDSLKAFVGGGLTHRSDSTSDFGSDPLFDIDAYTLVDVRAGVASADEKWRVWAWSQNLTDEYYWHSVIRVQDSIVRIAAIPRTYGVTLSYRF